MKIKIYGSRGSISCVRGDNINYGGNTTCVRLDIDGHTVIIDCGSGLLGFSGDMEKEDIKEFDILLSHLHIDHIIGLSMFPPLWREHNGVRIFTKSRSELPLDEQVFGIFKPPYWPVDLSAANKTPVIEIDGVFTLGSGIKVTPFPAHHSDDTTAFRIDADKSVVYMLDYEIKSDLSRLDEIAAFCRNADVIIFDACYMPRDYDGRRGWGHSTYEDGIILAEKSACKQMIFSHLSYEYSDEEIYSADMSIGDSKYLFGFDGMEMTI